MTTLPKYLTQDELRRFFAAIESPRDKALFGVIYHYGLRVSEALMLTVDDVNFKNHRITVRRLKNGLGRPAAGPAQYPGLHACAVPCF
jgi:integrase